jgi:hypothetical protein
MIVRFTSTGNVMEHQLSFVAALAGLSYRNIEITPDVPLPRWQEIPMYAWPSLFGVGHPIPIEAMPDDPKDDGKWTPADGHAIGEPKGPGRVECSCGWPGPPASADAGLYPGSVGWNEHCLKAWNAHIVGKVQRGSVWFDPIPTYPTPPWKPRPVTDVDESACPEPGTVHLRKMVDIAEKHGWCDGVEHEMAAWTFLDAKLTGLDNECARRRAVVEAQAKALNEWRRMADQDAGRLARYQRALTEIGWHEWPAILDGAAFDVLRNRARQELVELDGTGSPGRAAGPGGTERPGSGGTGHSASEGAKLPYPDGKAER